MWCFNSRCKYIVVMVLGCANGSARQVLSLEMCYRIFVPEKWVLDPTCMTRKTISTNPVTCGK